MKALILNIDDKLWENTRGFELEEVPIPDFDPKKDAKKVLIKVHYTGICGSDRSVWNRETFKDVIFNSLHKEKKKMRVLGHEFVGEIIEVGNDVEEKFDLHKGQVISSESHLFCGRCYFCKHGQSNICENELIMGVSIDGCFAEYVKLPAYVLWPTNTKKIRKEVAAIQEPFGNAVHAASKVSLQGKTVAIFGCGSIGQFLILLAKTYGATTIIGVDPNEKNRTIAQELGAQYTLSTTNTPYASDKKLYQEIRNLTNGRGVDVSFEMSGFNASVNNALQNTSRGGDIILFGLKSGDFTIQHFDSIILDGKNLHGVIGREIFASWFTTQQLLENSENKIQKKIFNVMLNEGNETIIPIDNFSKVKIEELFHKHPKIIIKW